MKKFGGFLLAAIFCATIPSIGKTENLSDREVDRLIPKFPLFKMQKAKNNIVLRNMSDSELELLRVPSQEIRLQVRAKSGIRLTSDKKKAFLDPVIPAGTMLFEITEAATNATLYCTDYNISNFRKCFGDVNNDNILDYFVDAQNSSQGILNVEKVPDSLKYAILFVGGVPLSMPIPQRPSYETIDSNAFPVVDLKLKISQKRDGKFRFQMSIMTEDNKEDIVMSYDIQQNANPETQTMEFGAFSIKLDTSATAAAISLDKFDYEKTLIGFNGQSFSPLPIMILFM